MRPLRINILDLLSQNLATGTNTSLTPRKRPRQGETLLKLLNTEYLGNRWKNVFCKRLSTPGIMGI